VFAVESLAECLVANVEHVEDEQVELTLADGRVNGRCAFSCLVVPRAGDTVWQGQSLLYLPDLSAMVVKTQVREEDLHKLRMGQPALVRVEAYPDAKFEGVVSSVGVLAVESSAQGAAGKHFQLAVDVRGGDARLRPGMTARVTIVADRVRNSLAIPVAALHYDGAQPTCYVHDGYAATPRKVTVGRRGDDLLEITAGLREGERVVLARP